MSDAETRCAKCGMVELHHNHTYWESTHPFAPAPVAEAWCAFHHQHHGPCGTGAKPVADGGEILTREEYVDEKLRRRCTEKFDALIEPLRAVAREHGYALAVHGSLKRDIDLIAAPWIEQASAPDVLASALRDEADRVTGCAFWLNDAETPENANDYTRRNPHPKPHGRLAWSIHLGGGPYIDLSVTPPSTEIAALRAEVGRLKDALDRQAAHYGGALSIEKARADAAERDASMLRRALNDAESALGAELKKTDRLERALREISRNIAENLPMTGLDAHINAIAAAALAQKG